MDEWALLLREGEGSRTEFKRGLPRESKVARTLAAFANTRGGVLFVGVDDRGHPVGAPRPRDTLAEVRRIAREAVRPPLAVDARIVDLEGARIVLARVGLSDERPHRVDRDDGEEEVPFRHGSSTRRAGPSTLRALASGSRADGYAGLSDLERRALAWVEAQGDAGTTAAGRTTASAFAAAANVGVSRARRTLVKLERAGRLFGHGRGAGRTWSRP